MDSSSESMPCLKIPAISSRRPLNTAPPISRCESPFHASLSHALSHSRHFLFYTLLSHLLTFCPSSFPGKSLKTLLRCQYRFDHLRTVRLHSLLVPLQLRLLLLSSHSSSIFLRGALDETTIIAIAVAGGALLLIVIIVAIIFGVKSIRQRVLPHRDRASFKKGVY